jgi:hypothetical protein
MRVSVELRADLELEANMADQNEGQTDKDQATLFAALSELRVLAEKNLEKTDEIVMQGVRQIEEGQAWRRKLQEFINRDNEIFEMIRSTYRKAGSDKGYISTGNINGDVSILLSTSRAPSCDSANWSLIARIQSTI